MTDARRPRYLTLRSRLGHACLGVVGSLLLLAGCSDMGFLPKVTVNVSGSGSGSGTVVSSDPVVVINCTVTNGVGGAVGCSATFDDAGGGGRFNLVATPAPGSSFTSWSGCSSSSGTTCTLSFLASATELTLPAVTATFTRDPPPPPPVSCNNPVIIEDPFTSDAGWATSVSTSGPTMPTQSVVFQGFGGNPGGYRQMQHVFTGLGAISVNHEYVNTTYDPSTQGAIVHINYYEDEILINPPVGGAAIGAGFTVSQAGTRYSTILWPPSGAFTNVGWGTASLSNLTAASFSPGLNFSSTGGPITFGYSRSNTNTGGGAVTLTHGIDNWRVEICR